MAKKDFELEMKALDRDNGGIFPVLKRSILEGYSFLIISYGGTGSDALSVIKKNLERNIEKEQRDKKVRLLAIDTDFNTQFTSAPVENSDGTVVMQPVKRFEDSEFFWLNNAPALRAIKLYKSDSAMQQWINPELPKAIEADPTKLDGSGASSTRQLGRLLLYPQQTVSDLQTKITTLAGQITNGTANNLKVLIVSGISGGTGSGIVVDATYLVRSFIDAMPGGMALRTEYCGFLLLPPTGTSSNAVNITKGNRNGIAALKEIDHFMTIPNRGEEYRMNFSGRPVVSKDRIFKTCYLVDGVFSGMAVSNPREKANEVVSDCILDMMTSQATTNSAGVVMQTVDAFMSDASAYSLAMVSGTTEHRAPRNANYVYCAIGHGKVLIPIELLRAYVAKEVFDAVYAKLQKASGIQDGDVSEFVKEAWTKPFNAKEQCGRIMSEVSACFADYNKGPFFVVNLLKEVADYAGQQHKVVEQRAFELNKSLKLDNYLNIQKEALRLNRQYFNTYVKVLEEMKKYLAVQHEIICKSDLLEKYGGSTYTFTPIDFGNGDAATAAVRDYLNGLVNMPKVKGRIAAGLLKEMADKRDEWTQLETPSQTSIPKFDAPTRIRLFWQQQMDKLISATLEDFLIKYYAGNPDACYEEIQTEQGMQPTPASAQYLQQAAQAIVSEMWGKAGIAKPLAETNDILPNDSFNAHYYFLIPQSAPHLRKAVDSVLASRGIKNVIVNESYADDCLSCYSQFTGMPGFIFSWVQRAEPDYEEALRAASIGLHMSETKGGERWQNYPNLLVEGVWDRFSPSYDNPRERENGRLTEIIFSRASEFGLTLKKALAVNANVGYYTVFMFPASLRPDELLFKDVDTEKAGTPAYELADAKLRQAVEEKAQALLGLVNWADAKALDKTDMKTALETLPADGSKVGFVARELNFVNTVMTPDPAQPVPVGWEERLATELLRTSPQYMYEARGTVLVMDRLFELVQKAQSARLHCRAFAHFLAARLFSYNEEYLQWTYQNGLQEVVLFDMDYGVDAQQYAKYYFLYQSFEENFGYAYAALKGDYEDLMSGASKIEIIQNSKKMKENAITLEEEVTKALTPDRINPKQASILITPAFRQNAEALGYDVDAIISFYQTLKNELTLVPHPKFPF